MVAELVAQGVAVGGPIMAVLAARLPAKPVIVGVMLTFALGQALCAIAPDYGLLMTGSLVLVLPVIVLFVLLQRHFTQSIAMTGLKG